jgi:DNA-binding LacI/PurR family transcriptional regulator
MSSSPTIRTLAERLGIGRSTVQRALIGTVGISPELRKRVLAAAAEMGYHPDPLFSILGSRKRKVRKDALRIVYLIGSVISREHVGTDLFPELALQAEKLGYQAVKHSLEELAAGKRLMEVLYCRGFIGAIIGLDIRRDSHSVILANTHLPLVCCGRIDDIPVHTVLPDATQSMRLTWARMLEAGYRRIGVALGPHSPPVIDDSDRLGAALALQEETLKKSEKIPILRTAMNDDSSLLKWHQKYRPEAVIGFRIGQYYALRDSGVDMNKVAFASLHTSNDAAANGISGCLEDTTSMARETVNLLDSLIRHRYVGIPECPIQLLVPSRWIEGTTLPFRQIPVQRPKRVVAKVN